MPGPLLQFADIKVRCENWYWSRKLQIILADAIGCKWGMGITSPWNTRRPFLVIQHRAGGWYMSWATANDFLACPLPEWSAKALVEAYPG